MEILENKALVFTTRKAAQITALIPRSKVLATRGDKARMMVFWGDAEVRILRNLKIKGVPHPILGRYRWPGVYVPYEHQRTTAAFLATHPRCFCLSEAGTGKTSAAAWAADYLMSKKQVRRVLVVCPVSIMDTAWRADLFRTVMHRTVGIATGTAAKRRQIVEGPYEVVIINFDGIPTVHKELQVGGFDLIIVDEANAVKNVSTRRWKALASLVQPTTRLWLMTGTPAAQSPEDAYGLAKLVCPERVPRFFGAFRDKVMLKISAFKWVPRDNAKDTVYETLQPAIRFTKAECLDLPELVYTTRDVPLTDQQRTYYERVRQDMVAMAAGAEITAINAASLLNKLLQISQGAAYASDGDTVEFDIGPRIEELMNVIEGTDHKVIVFVPFRHVLEKIQDELNARIVRLIGASNGTGSYAVAAIHGGTPASERATLIKQFQADPNPRIMLIIPQAAAHGITLTRADTIVWWGPTPSAELYIQGNARAHRAGQTNKVTVVRLQGSPVERKMYKMLDDKVDLHGITAELFRDLIA